MRQTVGVALVTLAVGLNAQSANLSERILSTAGRAFVTVDTLVADVAAADVVLLHEPSIASAAQPFQIALLQALADRRGEVIVALDVVNRSSQEPLEHFQMGHLSDTEFVAESGIPMVYLPLLKFAAARSWPIVATGPSLPDAADEVGGAIVRAFTIGAAGGRRPLVVSVHGPSGKGKSDNAAALVRQQLAGKRVLTLKFVTAPSLEHVLPPAVIPTDFDYIVYTTG